MSGQVSIKFLVHVKLLQDYFTLESMESVVCVGNIFEQFNKIENKFFLKKKSKRTILAAYQKRIRFLPVPIEF